MKIDLQKLLVFLCFISMSFASSAREIYVAKNGNDTNPGTQESPYLTIGKAAQEAVAGDIVFIREGTYEEILRPANSGTAGNPIIFSSFPGERVIISAMQSLSGWVNDSGSIYKTTIDFPSLNQQNFVMNGDTALDLARWPNNVDGDPFTLDSRRNDGGSGADAFASRQGNLTSSAIPNIDWSGGALFFYGDKGGAGWIAWKEFITNSTAGQVNFTITKQSGVNWIYTVHSPADNGDFYLEGVKGALDYQNEWWFDGVSKELFVQLPGGVAPQDGMVRMRRRELTINLNSRSFIEVRNLAVFGGAVELKSNSNDNKLVGISSFYGNHTQGIYTGFNGGSSVEVTGSRNVIEQCEIAFGAASGLKFGGNFNELKNTFIHDFDFLGSYDAPLVARGGRDNKIIGNTISNGGRDGINYNGQRCEIAFNDVYRSNLIADDCGLFYTTGNQPNTEIHHNWFHDAYSSGDKFKAAGVYLDTNPEGFSVHHNVIWNTEWTGVQMNWDAKDVNIYNNTIWNNESGVMGAWHKTGTSFTNINVWNNAGGDDKWEEQSDKQNNLTVTADVFGNVESGSFRLVRDSEPIDAGRVIDGITVNITGDNPDVGAYEFGDDWVAGIDWNTKLGPAGLGCYGLPGEDCIALPENDADLDGVSDANDTCANTPAGDTVDVNGCSIFTLAADNFKILTSGESCVGSNNGRIVLEAKENLQYTAELMGTSMNQAFTTDTNFEDLTGGTYTVCVTVAGQASYEQCFTVNVNEAQNLKVSSEVNTSERKISLNLKGGALYRIELNNKIIMTDKESIILDLQNGKNNLAVSTDKDCQGIHKESISINSGIFIFPNPVKNTLIISLPGDLFAKNVSWELFSYRGQRILGGNRKATGSGISIDMSRVATGSYFIKITTPESIIRQQIIKK